MNHSIAACYFFLNLKPLINFFNLLKSIFLKIIFVVLLRVGLVKKKQIKNKQTCSYLAGADIDHFSQHFRRLDETLKSRRRHYRNYPWELRVSEHLSHRLWRYYNHRVCGRCSRGRCPLTNDQKWVQWEQKFHSFHLLHLLLLAD